MINSTDLIRYMERRFGCSHHTLELTADAIMDIVKQETLPVFSNYYPYETQITIDPEADKVVGEQATYYIRTDYDILGVSRIFANGMKTGTGLLPLYSGDPINNYLTNNSASMMETPITFNYRPPNIVEVFPKNILKYKIIAKLKVVHPDHLQTIPLSLREYFYQLAYYDVCISLYPIRGRFTNINTSFANIELFMSELEQASDRRNELLQERFRRQYFKAANRKKIFIA